MQESAAQAAGPDRGYPDELREIFEVPEPEPARKLAEALPVDYEDLVHAAVAKYLDPEGADDDALLVVYLAVFDDDPSDELLARFSIKNVDVRPKSAYENDKQNYDASNPYYVWRMSAYSVLQQSDDEYTVRVSHDCGGLCGGGYELRLHSLGSNIRIVGERMLWIE